MRVTFKGRAVDRREGYDAGKRHAARSLAQSIFTLISPYCQTEFNGFFF